MELLEQCHKWNENDEYQKIIDTLEAIPAGERTPEMDSELARAYNNLAGPEEPVSAIPFVRTAMVAAQQKMGERKGIVMDGRDIGTTVFPHAELKIFVTASAETRAQRRVDELRAKGVDVDFDEVVANINKRDHIDQTRKESPLRKAEDAIELDNSHMTIVEQDAWLMTRYRETVEKLR